jgi:tRNA threonylcarbamoyladenosine biosynthesis protein TsaB
MKILAVDTATRSCSVAIVDKESLLAEVTLIRDQTHSRHLMGMIKKANELSGLFISDMDGFAVTRGPGSFTGLRIGLSTIKGLAAASGKPMVGVSSLEVLAIQSYVSSFLICPLIDARRGEVYYSNYRYKNGRLSQMIAEQVATPKEALTGIYEPCIFVGTGATLYQETIRFKLGEFAHFAAPAQNTISAATVAFLSLNRFQSGDTDDDRSLTPCYLRKSDAEINLAQKRQNYG